MRLVSVLGAIAFHALGIDLPGFIRVKSPLKNRQNASPLRSSARTRLARFGSGNFAAAIALRRNIVRSKHGDESTRFFG